MNEEVSPNTESRMQAAATPPLSQASASVTFLQTTRSTSVLIAYRPVVKRR